MIQSAKLISAGLATISLAGSGVGIGVVFASLIGSIAKVPASLKQLLILTENFFPLVGRASVFTVPATEATSIFEQYDSLYEEVDPIKMAILLTGTLFFSWGIFAYANNKLPIQDPALKWTASFGLGAIFAASNIYFVLSKIPLYQEYTMYHGFVCLVLVYFVGRSIVSPPFRDKVRSHVTVAFNGFLKAIESTIETHFGTKPPIIFEYLFFIYYFTILTVLGIFFEACFLKPELWATLPIFIIGCFVRYQFAKRWRSDFTYESFIAGCFYAFILFVLIIAIGANLTLGVTVLFFSLVLLCYFDGYGSMVDEMENYKKEYQAALPKINAIDPFLRIRLKWLHWAITIFPLFKSSYLSIFTYAFAFAFLFKLSALTADEGVESYRGFQFHDQATFADTAVLYSGLFSLLFSFVILISTQHLIWKFWNKESTTLYALINLTSYETVCKIVENSPGRAATEVVSAQTLKWAAGVAIGVLAGKEIAKSDVDLQATTSHRRSEEYAYRSEIAKSNSATGSLTVEQDHALRTEINQEIKTPSVLGSAVKLFSFGQGGSKGK